jgi:hypothetical protein
MVVAIVTCPTFIWKKTPYRLLSFLDGIIVPKLQQPHCPYQVIIDTVTIIRFFMLHA